MKLRCSKDYSTKLFWAAVAVVVDADEFRGTVLSLVVTWDKAVMGSMNVAAENIPIGGY